MIKRFIHYYKPHKWLFLFDMLCSFLVAACDLFYPGITGNIIDDYVPNQNLRMLIVWGVALLVIFIIKMILNYIIQYYGHVVGVRMQADMRRDVFAHMQKLPYSYFDEHKTGSLMSRIVNDLMDVSELAHHGPENLFTSAVMFIMSFILLCTINWVLTVIIFIFVPVLVLTAAKLRNKMRSAFTKTREEIAGVNAKLENSISGIRVSKAFVTSEYEEEKFEENNRSYQRAREFAYRAMAEFHSSLGFLTDFLNLVVMVGGGLFCFMGYITAGEYVKYLLYTTMFLTPIRKIIDFIEQLQNGMSGFERFTEIMDAESEKENPQAVDVGDVHGDIDYSNVSFSYNDGTNVLSDISFSIKSGETVAFVGPSGSGKTTLCHLLPRFYDINSGNIKIDGRDIKDFTYTSLRENIGIVQQDVFLFTGTIWDNIIYGDLNADPAAVVEAAKNANIHDFIESLPEKYQTYIGERGIKLSGGQKQRIAIARLFLKKPPILILDEATSALDNATEYLIQSALDKLSEHKTTLVVAHRLSTIKNADKIIVLTEKGIEEAGSHQELLQNNGLYKTLYNSQFKTDTVK